MLICLRSKGWPTVASNSEALNDSRNTPRSSGRRTGMNSHRPSMDNARTCTAPRLSVTNDPSLTRSTVGHVKVTLMGTRGVPAQYGGFETAVEEIGKRLVTRGYDVTVYCRNPGQRITQYEGMQARQRPGHPPSRGRDALAHGSQHGARHRARPPRRRAPPQRRQRTDAAPARARRHPHGHPPRRPGVQAREVARRRAPRTTGGPSGRRSRWGQEVIADAEAIADHVRREYGRECVVIPYGASVIHPDADRLARPGRRRRRVPPHRGAVRAREPCARRGPRLPREPGDAAAARGRQRSVQPVVRRERARGRACRPPHPLHRRHLRPGAARPAVRERHDLHPRALGRRHEPVAAAGHGRRRAGPRLRRGVQPRGDGRARRCSGRMPTP